MKEKKKASKNAGFEFNERNGMAALSYAFVLVLLPLLMEKDSEFIQFHAKQGFILFVIWILVLIISSIPIIGWILAGPLNLVLICVALYGAVQALQGKKKKIPVLSRLSHKVNL